MVNNKVLSPRTVCQIQSDTAIQSEITVGSSDLAKQIRFFSAFSRLTTEQGS